MPEPVVIVDYDPAWPARYAALRGPIAEALGDLVTQIEHVGSTSVPGLAAKPTIDFVVRLRAARDQAAAIERLAAIGYRHEGDLGVAGREAFATPPGYGIHDHHFYLCAPGWPGFDDQVAFRDYLRAHSNVADAYGALKRSLAMTYESDRAGYTNAKADFVNSVLRRARAGDAQKPI